jgi:hypothetical protein
VAELISAWGERAGTSPAPTLGEIPNPKHEISKHRRCQMTKPNSLRNAKLQSPNAKSSSKLEAQMTKRCGIEIWTLDFNCYLEIPPILSPPAGES